MTRRRLLDRYGVMHDAINTPKHVEYFTRCEVQCSILVDYAENLQEFDDDRVTTCVMCLGVAWRYDR